MVRYGCDRPSLRASCSQFSEGVPVPMTTQVQVAKHLDLTSRRVRELIADGALPKGSGKGLDLAACRLAYIHFLRKTKGSKVAQPIEDEKMLLIREQRIAQQMKNDVSRRELLPASLISWTLSKVGAQISSILDAIPLKVKTIAPRLTATEIGAIRREIVKCQNAAASVGVDVDEFYGVNPAANEVTMKPTPGSPPQ
jgi:phage terminase Nu1 subunit (DNA packaging protein)